MTDSEIAEKYAREILEFATWGAGGTRVEDAWIAEVSKFILRAIEESRQPVIKHMVERFLGWRLPENFNPDGGISFKRAINENRPSWPQENEPTGTNLFDYSQAEEMVRYMLDGAEVEERRGQPVEYWKSRAETAELKVLTFQEEIANLRAAERRQEPPK